MELILLKFHANCSTPIHPFHTVLSLLPCRVGLTSAESRHAFPKHSGKASQRVEGEVLAYI